jgi:F0F1-type ATP synthase delta subunit
VDPRLIGGLVVQIGDCRFDNSVRRHLRDAHTRLMERSTRGLSIGVEG